MFHHKKIVVAMAALLISGPCLAKTFTKELLINNESKYDMHAVGAITEYVTFELPDTIPATDAKVIPMTFDTGGWFSSHSPHAAINLSVRCPSGEVDTILIDIENGKPVVLEASSFNSMCVKVAEDKQRIEFDDDNSLAQIDIVNK